MDSAQIIDLMGGPTKVAEALDILGEPGAVQRVSNWKRRGIPPAVLLKHRDVFERFELAHPTPATAAQDAAEQEEVA